MLIALTGYARSGKDTVGGILVEEHGFHRVAFADALKAHALRMDPILEVEPDLDTAPYRARLSEICSLYGGLEQAKELPAVRRYLQDLGSECRETFGKDAWVTAARLDEAVQEYGDVVVTDCRYRNEARHVRRLDGLVVRVVRPGVQPANLHPSEIEMAHEPVSFEIFNAGTVHQLGETVSGLLEEVAA